MMDVKPMTMEDCVKLLQKEISDLTADRDDWKKSAIANAELLNEETEKCDHWKAEAERWKKQSKKLSADLIAMIDDRDYWHDEAGRLQIRLFNTKDQLAKEKDKNVKARIRKQFEDKSCK